MEDVRTCGLVEALGLVERVLTEFGDRDPADVLLRDVTAVWAAYDRVERRAANAKVLLAARVAAAGEWKRAGARSAASHLAQVSGTSTAVARRGLETSAHLEKLPVLAAAVRSGVLSSAQVEVIAPAVAADPGAQAELIALAGETNLTELRERCLRKTAAADPDPEARHRRIHANRHVRSYTDGQGARHMGVYGTADQLGVFESRLEPIIDQLFKAAQAAGKREPRNAYAFDALMLLGRQPETNDAPTPTPKPRYYGILQASLEALTRGAVDGEELCEIAGVGPIPVRIARELLGDAILKLVITKGVDVVNVVHLGRGATAAQRVALLWSKPKCTDIACSSRFVQIDHREPWATTHHTVLHELDPLCPHHHKLKTEQGWSLVPGKGRRAFVGPKDPRHPRNRPPP